MKEQTKESERVEWARELIKKYTIRKDGFIDVLQLGFEVIKKAHEDTIK